MEITDRWLRIGSGCCPAFPSTILSLGGTNVSSYFPTYLHRLLTLSDRYPVNVNPPRLIALRRYYEADAVERTDQYKAGQLNELEAH